MRSSFSIFFRILEFKAPSYGETLLGTEEPTARLVNEGPQWSTLAQCVLSASCRPSGSHEIRLPTGRSPPHCGHSLATEVGDPNSIGIVAETIWPIAGVLLASKI